MIWKQERKSLLIIAAVFFIIYFLPVGSGKFNNAVIESLYLLKWYAREHVVLCLLPALFIAGAISVFVRESSVLKYLGSRSNKVLSYGVASVSGAILAVCSCTILPLFAGIYRIGAGLGPAVAFLYSGPAINVLAIILTARILGLELGIARAVGAVVFSIVIGLIMALIFRNEEEKRAKMHIPETESKHSLKQIAGFFGLMVGILVFANWSEPPSGTGFWYSVYSAKWIVTSVFWIVLAVVLVRWYELKWQYMSFVTAVTLITGFFIPDHPVIPFFMGILGLSIVMILTEGEAENWFQASWDLTKQILPLLFAGILVSGILLGRPGEEGLIPASWISGLVGGNSISANLYASVIGSLMYFATLTEVPILQGLIGNGMGKGPALALLLAGPALSLPNMLVIRSIIGTKKTLVFVLLVVIMAALSGYIFGTYFG
ncbi:permease [candidate division KSB1 bacterium]